MKLKHPDKNWQSTRIENEAIPEGMEIKLISIDGIHVGINIKFPNNKLLKIGAISNLSMMFGSKSKIVYEFTEEDSKSEFDDIEILNNISDNSCAYDKCLYKVEFIILGQECVKFDIKPPAFMHKDCYLKWIKTS